MYLHSRRKFLYLKTGIDQTSTVFHANASPGLTSGPRAEKAMPPQRSARWPHGAVGEPKDPPFRTGGNVLGKGETDPGTPVVGTPEDRAHSPVPLGGALFRPPGTGPLRGGGERQVHSPVNIGETLTPGSQAPHSATRLTLWREGRPHEARDTKWSRQPLSIALALPQTRATAALWTWHQLLHGGQRRQPQEGRVQVPPITELVSLEAGHGHMDPVPGDGHVLPTQQPSRTGHHAEGGRVDLFWLGMGQTHRACW